MTLRTLPLAVFEAGLIVAWSSGFIRAHLAADASSVFLVLFWRFLIVALILAPSCCGLYVRIFSSGRSRSSLRSACSQCSGIWHSG